MLPLKSCCRAFHVTLFVVLLLLTNPQMSQGGGITRVCGDKLVKLVKQICQGCIAGLGSASMTKRSSANFPPDDDVASLDLMAQTTKRAANIVQMCCKNRCSYRYIKQNFCCA